jgi:hypothetical protein
MPAPRYVVTLKDTANKSWNSDSAGTKADRTPSWCVAFVRFKTPGAMFIGKEDPFAERSVLIVENDCVSVDVDNQKSSFAKMCTLNMKIGEVYYRNAVSPGDWVFVWMSDQQDNIEQVLDRLMKDPNGTSRRRKTDNNNMYLNNWDSGFKFVGRVISVPETDTIQAGGQRVVGQSITCQAFLEMASSVYYTFIAQNVLTLDQKIKDEVATTAFFEQQINGLSGQKKSTAPQKNSQGQKPASNGLEAALTNLSYAFDNFYRRLDGKDESVGDTSPEAIIGLMFIITMGVDAKDLNARVDKAIPGATGTFSDAIGIPKSVSGILGKKGNKLWQMYNVYLGLQKYSMLANPKQPWKMFMPDLTPQTDVANSVFYSTPTRCKGFVPFLVPPIWDNNTFWNIYGQFLNPIVNEMYTALRVNRDGRIMPALIVREKPFSTKLFDKLLKVAPTFVPKKGSSSKQSSAVKGVKKSVAQEAAQQVDAYKKEYERLASVSNEITTRTMYNNVPRWVLDESVVKSVNTASAESARINFVQVWGRSRGVEMLGLNVNQEVLKQAQFLVPNYIADVPDIKRHGLRADISETNYDVISSTMGTISHILCRMRGDWLFNGHLKLSGTITCAGITEPICEGDNVECRGILYHIDAVHHSGSLSSSGQKQFTTTLTVSNGIVAASLDSEDGIPTYAVGLESGSLTEQISDANNLPGYTDVQATGPRKGRNEDGE